MLSNKSLVIYELNEVPERVLQLHIANHPSSTLAALVAHGTKAQTHAVDTGVLSPWITWPTLHRGINNERHCISDFGQDLAEVDREYPPVWQMLANRGVRTGVFGSLHSYPLPASPEKYAFFMPDTFAAGPETWPESLGAFQKFNLAMVDASARNVGSSIIVRPALDLLKEAPRLGLRGSTLARLGKQLVGERLNTLRRVRRRTSQAQLAFDLYLKQLETTRPAFSSFFTNHVASSMHRYWPATFPTDYRTKQLPDAWKRSFADEIGFSMREADRQLGHLVAFVKRQPGYVLVVLTSMGQAAVDNPEVVRKQLYIGDRGRFMQRLGVGGAEWSPQRAMLPRYIFQVDGRAAEKLRENLRTIRINGEPLEVAEHNANTFMVKLGHINLVDEEIEVQLEGRQIGFGELGFVNQAIEDESGSYAYHIPQGVMLVYTPNDERRVCIETPIPTTQIAPMFLRNFNLDVPGYMA